MRRTDLRSPAWTQLDGIGLGAAILLMVSGCTARASTTAPIRTLCPEACGRVCRRVLAEPAVGGGSEGFAVEHAVPEALVATYNAAVVMIAAGGR